VPLLRVLLSLYSCSSSSFQGFKTRLLQKSTKSFDWEKHRIQIHERTRRGFCNLSGNATSIITICSEAVFQKDFSPIQYRSCMVCLSLIV
jgi:hypothetical protein